MPNELRNILEFPGGRVTFQILNAI